MSKKFIGLVSLFPDAFVSLTDHGVVGRALESDQVNLRFFNPRDYAPGNYRSVDETPFGGGQGMLMKYQPLAAALDEAIDTAQQQGFARPKVIHFTPRGRQLQQSQAPGYAATEAMVLLSGCYEGIDQRIIDSYVDEEVSLGDYVLSGGELPIMVFINMLARLWDDTLGNELSHQFESFAEGLLEEPQYTRPAEIAAPGQHARRLNNPQVPAVLSGGNHQAIAEWKRGQSLLTTWLKRPDLLKKQQLSLADKKILLKFM